MILKELVLNNFRQFYGEQKIEFCYGESNTTIIFGENGKGKTGIFRALIFALFGEKYLSQDDDKNKIHLINWVKLQEEKGETVKAFVKVAFSNNDTNYILKRDLLGYIDVNEIKEKIDGVELTIIDANGNCGEICRDESEVKAIVSSIINNEIKDFFLFDGEKIETLAKTNEKVRKEIKNGITKLLNINEIDETIDLLKGLKTKEEKRIAKDSSNLNLKEVSLSIEKLEEEIKEFNNHMGILSIDMEKCEIEIDNCKNALAENQEIKSLQESISQLDKTILAEKEILILLKGDLIKTNFQNSSLLLNQDNLIQSIEFIKNGFTSNEDIVGISVLEKILSDMKCICGADLNTVESAYHQILLLKKNYKRSNLGELLTILSETSNDINQTKEVIKLEIEGSLKKIRLSKDKIKSDEMQKEEIESNIKKLSTLNIDFKSLDDQLELRKSDKESINKKIILAQSQITLKEKTKAEKEKEYDNLIKDDKSLLIDSKKLKKLEELLKEFQLLFDRYTKKMREKLMQETTMIFKDLIDQKDRNLFGKIEINESYELNFYNWLGNKITQDISQGQRQIVALSFITALAKIASKDTVDFPLFMDTPFGRISGNNRDNLIQNIPQLTSQWVLLLTDTEFTYSEEKKMKETNTLGKCYMLDQIKDGVTIITEKNIQDSIAKRR